MSKEFKIALDDYIIHLDIERGLSELTIEGYKIDLKLFANFLDDRIFNDNKNWQVNNIRARHIRAFLAYLKKERKNSPEAMNRKIVALHTFFKFLIRTGDYNIKKDPSKDFKKLKTENKLPEYLSLDESKKLLKIIPKVSNHPERDLALYQLFLQTGCRVSEVSTLKLSNLSFNENYIKIKGKGSKERIIPITETTNNLLMEYIKVRRPTVETDIVFLNTYGKPISNDSIRNNLKKYYKAAGIYREGLAVHSLRHTCFTLLYKKGVDIRVIKDLAGHENISTTEIYTHLTNEELINSMEKHPLG